MATFHEGISERKNKEIASDDSPYHIFTPDDVHLQDDAAVMYSFSTFQPRQAHHQGLTANIPDVHSSRTRSSISNKSTEDNISSSLPRHGSHGSRTATFIPSMSQRNRSTDNIAASFVKSLPPRGQYRPSIASSFTKTLPPRRAHHGSITNTAVSVPSKYPNDICMLTPERNNSQMQENATPNYQPQEYDRLQPAETNTIAPSMVQRNAAYKSVVRRPFKETGCNSPVFDIESEQDPRFNMDIIERGNWPHSQTTGNETNFFEMCSDDSLKNDLGELKSQDEQKVIEKPSHQPFNDYENVKEYIPSSTYNEHNTTPAKELKLLHTLGVQSEDPGRQEIGKTNDPSACKHSPSYENVKDYNQHLNTECNKTPEWIPLAAITSTFPNLDTDNHELSIPAPVPKIVVQAEQSSINETSSEEENAEQGNIASLGKDLRKSADLETLSDYEEMAASFSSHYTAVKSNQQQPFPFLSSTEVEGQITLQQEGDEKHDVDNTNSPMGDTQQSEHTGSEPTNNTQVPAPNRKKEKCFQYCLIFITLVIAIAALVMSTMIFIDIKSGNNNTTMHY